jgi:hypothetical protein
VNYSHAIRCGNTGFDHYGWKLEWVGFAGNWFSCVNNKIENAYGFNTRDSFEYIYATESDYEFFYIGNTSGSTQQIQDSLYIGNCALLGAGGEVVQVSWCNNCIIEYLVTESGKSLFGGFQGGQSGDIQEKSGTPGYIINRHIVAISRGGNINLEQRNTNPSVDGTYGSGWVGDTIMFDNMYIGGNCGPNVFFLGGDGQSHHAVVVKNSDIGHHNGVSDSIWGLYNSEHDTITAIMLTYLDPNDPAEWKDSSPKKIILYNNQYDNTIDSTFQYNTTDFGAAKFGTDSNNVRASFPRPDFENYMGITLQGDTLNGINYDPNRYFHFRRFMGETAQDQCEDGTKDCPSGSGYTTLASNTWPDPIPWKKGMICSDYDELDGNKMKFYMCLQDYADTSVVPWEPEDTIYWKELTWQMPNGWISYHPPRNVYLKTGSYHQLKGRGFQGVQ